MSTLIRISYIDHRGFVVNEWRPTSFTADDRVKELDTLGMESIDYEEADVPFDDLANLIHWLNTNPNSPPIKDGTMFDTFDKAHSPDSLPALPGGGATFDFGPGRVASLESDPHGLSANAPGAKLDAGKTRPWLCIAGFSLAFEAVAEVTTVGAAKYSDNGWMAVPDGEARYMEAFGRHMLALGRGEVFDNGPKGTGARHKAQMIWNLLASLELELRAGES